MENVIIFWAVLVKYSRCLSQTATLVVTYAFFSKYIIESSVRMLFISAKIDNTCCSKLGVPLDISSTDSILVNNTAARERNAAFSASRNCGK